MSNRLSAPSTELLDFLEMFPRSVIDVHYYTLFDNKFNIFTVQQNIDYVNNTIAIDLRSLTRRNGALTFVGEWVAEWKVSGATQEEYQSFVNAHMDVYKQATFGWAYWIYKNVNNHWSMEWMIKNGYISLTNA
ncbi:hypothetical protein ACQJBY_004831 [Aegilops geniculata]